MTTLSEVTAHATPPVPIDAAAAPSLVVPTPRAELASPAPQGALATAQGRPPVTLPPRLVKQAWERVAAAVALVAVLPLLVLLGLAIRLSSPGPAIFRQTRIGVGGRPFTMYKLRTMRCDAHVQVSQVQHLNEADGLLFKVRSDPRITRIGASLRKYSLDELPQLVNIVLGHMSLVGPRPALPEEVARYDDLARRRLSVLPGLTGLWQVSGRSDLSWQEALRLDLEYVDRCSLWLDLQVLVRTVRAVLSHRGAY